MTVLPHAITHFGLDLEPRQDLFHRMPWNEKEQEDPSVLLMREWLVTNGLGGYASGTVSGIPTRRYHGALVAALHVPLGRTVMLSQLVEEFRLPGGKILSLEGRARADGTFEFQGTALLKEFRLESGLPVWHYQFDGYLLEKRVLMIHRQNTTHVQYRLLAGDGTLRIRIRPLMHFRHHEWSVASPTPLAYTVTSSPQGIEISHPDYPPLRLRLDGGDGCDGCDGAMVLQSADVVEMNYPLERSRGYDFKGHQWTPGYFRADLSLGETCTLIASTEDWEIVSAVAPKLAIGAEYHRRERLLSLAPEGVRSGMAAKLVLAADQFIITPNARAADAARSHALGDEVRTIIAGYHWFTDWGRDTMISLDGLCLCTGRHTEAGYILRTFAHHVRDGLIPNLFPEGDQQALYHTADASLWFFHAMDRYAEVTRRQFTLRHLLPVFRSIIDHHQRGTRFGIRVDPKDGLLLQGQQGYQLTWMDAKVGDWVVTPRRGKAVEINALWYNALRCMQHWVGRLESEEAARPYAEAADRVWQSFNERFWYAEGGHLYDVIDGEHGDDPSMRPNQLLAISLPHPVLERQYWLPVMDQVINRLLTPMGLRSLAPGDPNYKARYDGDLRARDAAYHQGTVWGWLIGPLIDAWLKVYPDRVDTARDFLAGFEVHLGEAGVGSISEIFDAEAPYTSRGCIAQAWSVAEVLRCCLKLKAMDREKPGQ